MAKSFPSSLGLVLPCYPVSSGASSLASPLLASWRSTLLHVPPSALLKNRTHFTKGGCSLCSPYTPAYSFLPFPEFWEKMSPAICLPHKWLCLTHSTAGMFARMRQTGRISSLCCSAKPFQKDVTYSYSTSCEPSTQHLSQQLKTTVLMAWLLGNHHKCHGSSYHRSLDFRVTLKMPLIEHQHWWQ